MCGSFLRLQHDWLSGNSRILHFRTGGTGKEERRRRSVLDGEAGAGIETWLRRTRPRPTETTPRDPRDCAGLTAPSHDRRKPIAADRLLSAQCRKRNSGLKLWPQVSQLRACDEVAQQLWTQRWKKRWSAGAAEQYLDGRVTITRQVVSSIQIRRHIRQQAGVILKTSFHPGAVA